MLQTPGLAAKMRTLNEDQFEDLIKKASKRLPFLTPNKKAVLSILALTSQTPFFLPVKPTPLAAAWAFLVTILGQTIKKEDFVFVLAALDIPIGVRISKSRPVNFKIFPEGVPDEKPSKAPVIGGRFTPAYINNSKTAEQVAHIMSDAFEPTRAERANNQTAKNKLLEQYELYKVAISLYRYRQEGLSLAQAKREMQLSERPYAAAYQILQDMGLVTKAPRKKRIEITETNIASATRIAKERGVDPKNKKEFSEALRTIVNELLQTALASKPRGGRTK